MLQEETIRRNERERKQMMDNVAQMERAISSLESDNRTLQVCHEESYHNDLQSLMLANKRIWNSITSITNEFDKIPDRNL